MLFIAFQVQLPFLGCIPVGLVSFVCPFFTDAHWIVLTYIPLSAVQVGVSNDFAFYLIAVANGCSAFGRISAGLLADRVGECPPTGMSVDSG